MGYINRNSRLRHSLNYFKILFNLDKAHMILNEMILNGRIVETNKHRFLAPIYVMDQASKR